MEAWLRNWSGFVDSSNCAVVVIPEVWYPATAREPICRFTASTWACCLAMAAFRAFTRALEAVICPRRSLADSPATSALCCSAATCVFAWARVGAGSASAAPWMKITPATTAVLVMAARAIPLVRLMRPVDTARSVPSSARAVPVDHAGRNGYLRCGTWRVTHRLRAARSV